MATECMATEHGQSERWGTLAQVSKMLGKTPSAAKSAALVAGIRVKALPGTRIQYSLEDAKRLLAGGGQ